jgi:CDP-paratose 2-epimerase
MKVLITGICGFVGSILARELHRHAEGLDILGIDNLVRPGSETNRQSVSNSRVRFVHGDIRNPSDLDALPKVDWVIDAAANPSILAGLGGDTSSRQLLEHNLIGTINLLEFCKRHRTGLIMLSTSRVYSIARLAALPLNTNGSSFVPRFDDIQERGFSAGGVGEDFSTEGRLSLYGCSKLASELLILEYGVAFDLPVHINRCGVLAGAGQFGKPDQGIFSYWIHSYRAQRPLKFIGFGGSGHQVRDCLHPRDLASLVAMQITHPEKSGSVLNVSGGMESSISLAQLNEWCSRRFGPRPIHSDPDNRPYDVPWLVLDSSRAQSQWGWRPKITLEEILAEIAHHAEQHPEWLNLSDRT